MHIVILSGGVGSRLWPVSRDSHPKPFIKFSDGESLLQKVYLRSSRIPSVQSITTVTNKELLFKTKSEYYDSQGKINSSFDSNYIVEPFGRNTAPAIALAAQKISSVYGDDSILLILPSDHIIYNEEAFNQAVMEAEAAARNGKIVVFGIKPSYPETGYGYIEANGNDVVRFVEKPSLEVAEQYFRSGSYLWNSGMFCFSAGSILSEMNTYCPDLLNLTKKCIEHSSSIRSSCAFSLEIDPVTFEKVPEDSIDYAIMEKIRNAAVVPCDIGWNDVGTWNAMHDLADLDSNGNSLKGEILVQNVKNCYIESNDRVIGAVGLENLIVVDTPDALLIASKNDSQDVKNIYNQLKNLEHDAHKLHSTVQRPWGTYTILEEGIGFKIKRIEVYPGASLSLQMHKHRAEHWVVVSGEARVINGDSELDLIVNQSTYIPVGNIHRLTNLGETKLVMIEVQTGSYLGEDDIVRFDDIYGRIAHAA